MASSITGQGIAAPVAKKVPFPIETHGHTRVDEYYWLNQREDEEVLSYLRAENEYLEQVMSPLKELREELFEEMKGRIKEDDESVPYKEGSYMYFTKFVKGGEYPVYCRKKVGTEVEEILLDGNALAEGHSYFHVGGMEISDDEQLLLFAVDTVGRRNYTAKVKNLVTGEILSDEIPETEGGNYAWAADSKTFYYVKKDQQTLLGNRVYRHQLGNQEDELVYEEKDNQYYMGIFRMKSKKYIAIGSEHIGVASEFQLLRADDPQAKPVTFLPRGNRHEYSIEHFEDKFYIRTNLNGAENFALMQVKEEKHADIAAWEMVIPSREEVFFEGLELFKEFMVVQERKEGLIQMRIIHHRTGEEHYVDFGEPAYTAFISINPEFDTTVLRYGYTSMTTPRSTYDYHMDTREKVLLKEQEVLGGFDKEDYVSERIFVTARDGAKVPVSIVYKKDTPLNGTSPLLQYAYGSYGATMDASFSPSRLSLLNRGFVYAIAHIRGGLEMGRQWYEQGRMMQKKNTFYDFIDCSKALVALGYAAKDKVFAMGGSAGGLLMGAVMNLAPEVYKGVVAAVPFVDVVTTMLDESIPLTTGEFEEWGNPKNEDSYWYMLSYSPYDNVEEKAYPNTLVTTGLHDSQVQYWEPAKWVAKLRDKKTDDNLLLLFTDMSAGHGGASGRFEALKTLALEYAFVVDLAKK
ncbi:Oligopeptidase B [Leadbetterella byssophila DSM 17132]|uniref:Proline-specific endopeptidase n=1 Tax=Leadbetterella byssophila (strain DSM 17132 / JCM 16389 / KACC 11308 / NBRC 106382 / 4M15) TaxID=649349 RepID=E4RV17_LEAB4|nr:oligopeptidase B [Leadbetterella byssophila]ADQ17897.1 Oligopeptidase B [Leadbetterella byssophila DSM 17132]